jgi:hypothetical protein
MLSLRRKGPETCADREAANPKLTAASPKVEARARGCDPNQPPTARPKQPTRIQFGWILQPSN